MGVTGQVFQYRRRPAERPFAVCPLEQKVSGQCDHHQEHQRFHATRRFQEHRMYGQNRHGVEGPPLAAWALVMAK